MKTIRGIGLWLGMVAQTWVLAAVTIICAIPWALYSLATPYRWALLDNAWRVVAIELARVVMAPLMPLWIAIWGRLPSNLVYLLNTPDDPYTITQGLYEAQVADVQNWGGEYWRRVYWLLRNCCYGVEVALRPSRPEFNSAGWSFDGKWVVCDSNAGVHAMRVTCWAISDRYLVMYWGPWLGAYLDSLVPVKINPHPEPIARNDVGGVPCLKAKIERANPLT